MILGIIMFVLGLAVGSFLNSFLYRYETKQKYTGRSFCPNCKHQISWFDNIPLLSYVILRGKCRHCKKPISLQYPAVELLTGLIFVSVSLFSTQGKFISSWILQISNDKFQMTNQILISNVLMLFILLIITFLLSLIAIHDARTKEIPNSFNLAFIAFAGVYLMLSGIGSPNFLLFTHSAFAQGRLFYFLLAGAIAFLFFWSLVWFSKETWMGGGDAKLAFGMGILLGPASTFVAIIIASWTGAIYGVASIIIQNAKIKNQNDKSKIRISSFIRNSPDVSSNYQTKKSGSRLSDKILLGKRREKFKIQNSRHEVPFGPFLALGTFISLLFGSQIVDWYVKIVLGL